MFAHVVIQLVLDLDHAHRDTILHAESDERGGRHVIRRCRFTRSQSIDEGEPFGNIFEGSEKCGTVDILFAPVDVLVAELFHLVGKFRNRKRKDKGIVRNMGDTGHRIGKVEFIYFKGCARHLSDNEDRVSFRVVFSAAPDEVRTGLKGLVGVVAVLS